MTGCCRLWASWRSRCPTWRSSCRRRSSRGGELTLEQDLANQALHQRRRIKHVNRSVKRYRIVKDRLRLWKAGVRDLVMALCPAQLPGTFDPMAANGLIGINSNAFFLLDAYPLIR